MQKQDAKIDRIIRSLKGSFEMPKNMDYKKELRNRLEKKYLRMDDNMDLLS